MVLSPTVSHQPKVIYHQPATLAPVGTAAVLQAFLSVLLEGSYSGDALKPGVAGSHPQGLLWLSWSLQNDHVGKGDWSCPPCF